MQKSNKKIEYSSRKLNRELRYGGIEHGEQKEVNSNIDLKHIYNAIRYLKPEQQGLILSTYKLTDLGSILIDRKNYEKYIADLLQGATAYINTVGALTALRKEAVKDSEKK